VGGMTTYTIVSPEFLPDDNAFLKLDVYFFTDGKLTIGIGVGDMQTQFERYVYTAEVKGGGKWKRIVLKAGDFKGEQSGMPLKSFALGKTLSFESEGEKLYAVTNILWL